MTASRITYDSLATAGVTAEELAALARQARGGASGRRGYGYEDHFAVSCLIAASVAWFERGEDWVVTLGHRCCWVDDVVVERPDAEQYAQLKTSPDETWGREDGRLRQQFRRQAEVCRARGVGEFALSIVTPHEDRRAHFESAMPVELRGTTTAVLFSDRPLGWDRGSPVAKDLEELCAGAPEPSMREQLLRAMYGAYHWMRQRGDVLTSSRFVAAIAADEHVPLRSDATVVDSALWAAVSEGLAARLPGLRLRLTRGFIFYEYVDDERGIVARADSERALRFLTRLAARSPATIDEFHQELP
ncbi:MAG: hypothetical protein JNK56_20575 [Myxococcales bacterium]|nr:hypothetical protein [Myxococcales bacterium]